MHLYIISCNDVLKVGTSKTPEIRVKQIISGAGLLREETYFKIFHDIGKIEKYIHFMFKDLNKNGEWFYRKGIVENFYEYICDKNDLTEIEIRNFFNNFLDDSEAGNQKKINKIFNKCIDESKLTYTDITKTYASFFSSVDNLSPTIIRTFKDADNIGCVWLLGDMLQYFYFDRQYQWKFPEKEKGLVKTFLRKFKIKYREC